MSPSRDAGEKRPASELADVPWPRSAREGAPMNQMAATCSTARPGLDAKYGDDEGSVITTRVDQMVNWLLNWGRSNSVWYLLFGLACCAIELMQTGGPRADLERFGSAPRPSPRSSDLIIVAGTLTYKMALRVQAPLRPDGRAAVRHLDGELLELRRPLPVRVLGLQGRRPDHPGRRLRPRLPAAPRGAARGAAQDSGQDQEARSILAEALRRRATAT